MPCPTCSHTMQNIGATDARVFWCARCGTLMTVHADGYIATTVPALVERVRDLRDTMKERVGFSAWDQATWHRLGILEAIYRPEERP